MRYFYVIFSVAIVLDGCAHRVNKNDAQARSSDVSKTHLQKACPACKKITPCPKCGPCPRCAATTIKRKIRLYSEEQPFFERSDAKDVGLDPLKVNALIEEAKDTHSSALLLLKDNKLVVEKYWDDKTWRDPLVTMSISKSIIALAIGQLIEAEKIKSLDQKLVELLPKKILPKMDPRINQITLRMLLNHTSGLQTRRAHRRRGFLRYHLRRSAFLTDPGKRFRYNNNAVDILGMVIKEVSGQFADDYLHHYLLGPLDISGAFFLKFQDGYPRLAGELFIRPVDLLKIGLLMLNQGQWGGKKLVDTKWIHRVVQKGQNIYPPCGLLWWRDGDFRPRLNQKVLDQWKEVGVDATTIQKAKSLLDKSYEKREIYLNKLERTIGHTAFLNLKKIAKKESIPFYSVVLKGKIWGFSARGSLGQYLLIIPKKNVVAVRMRKVPEKRLSHREAKKAAFGEFNQRVHELVF